MKRLLVAGGTGLLLGLLCLAWGWREWTGPGPAGPDGRASTTILIPRGMTLGAAADTLVARGLIRHRRTLLVGARISGQERGLRAGRYELSYGQSPVQLLHDLTAGLSLQVAVTIPEGLDSSEVAAVVAEKFPWSAERFLAVADSLAREAVRTESLLVSDAAFATHDSLLTAWSGGHWSEGLLAPDTYRFAEDTSPVRVASVLLATQLQRLKLARDAAASGINRNLSPIGLLTLASIVETEARRDDERELISAVYTNRLRRHWRLEADPTVAFVLDKKGKRLFYRDLKVDSPYNTYRVRGLPPGPIGTPGLASLMAAAQPDSTCRAMYFVSDGAGGHVFSRTASEHEAAVRRFRATRSRQR